MYYHDDFRQGYYCDQCDVGCCSNHWILCDDCMQKLSKSEYMASAEVASLKKELEILKEENEKLKNNQQCCKSD